MLRFLCPAALVLAAACTPLPQPDGPDIAGDLCGAAAWQSFIGARIATAQTSGLPASARIIRPGQAVTMDFSAGRLNVQLDRGDRIVRAYCG